jgi:hypothetical protein
MGDGAQSAPKLGRLDSEQMSHRNGEKRPADPATLNRSDQKQKKNKKDDHTDGDKQDEDADLRDYFVGFSSLKSLRSS